jgi:hypothetical protein
MGFWLNVIGAATLLTISVLAIMYVSTALDLGSSNTSFVEGQAYACYSMGGHDAYNGQFRYCSNKNEAIMFTFRSSP